MKAGALDRRVTLMKATPTTNRMNEEVTEWTPLATVWASRQFVSDGERVRAAQVGSEITARFQIRWSQTVSGIGTSDQLVCEGVTYGITAKKELGRRVGLELTATAHGETADPN